MGRPARPVGVLGESLERLGSERHGPQNAGTYIDTWTFKDPTGNYHDTFDGTVTSTIAKADAAITVTGYNVTYDGAAHQATGTVLGVLGESLAGLNLSNTIHTNVGTYSDTWTFTDTTGNYNDASGTVNSSINAATVATTTTISSSAATSTYGDAVTFTATVSAASGSVAPTGTVEFFDGSDVSGDRQPRQQYRGWHLDLESHHRRSHGGHPCDPRRLHGHRRPSGSASANIDPDGESEEPAMGSCHSGATGTYDAAGHGGDRQR